MVKLKEDGKIKRIRQSSGIIPTLKDSMSQQTGIFFDRNLKKSNEILAKFLESKP